MPVDTAIEAPTVAYPWWQPEGARVIAIRPYTGLYKQFFTHDVDIQAPNTHQGFMTASVNTLQDPDWFQPRSNA